MLSCSPADRRIDYPYTLGNDTRNKYCHATMSALHLFDDMKIGMVPMSPPKPPGQAPASARAVKYQGQTSLDGNDEWKMYVWTCGLNDTALSPSVVRICQATYFSIAGCSPGAARANFLHGLWMSKLFIIEGLRRRAGY